MINAIILAAGESKRMGKPKPLLKFEDRTFLEQIISVLKNSEVDRITAVLGAEAETVKESIDLSGIEVVINEDYEKGQLSSLTAGIKSAPEETDAIIVCLVDSPFINVKTINDIIRSFKEKNVPIIVPVFRGKRGHPVLFSKSMFKELLNAPEEHGARYVVYSNKERVFEVETSDREILIGINTPEDYRIHFGTMP